MSRIRQHLLFIGLLLIATVGFSQSSLRLNIVAVSDSNPVLGEEILVFTNLQNTDTNNTFTGVVNFEVANNLQNLSSSNILNTPPYSGTQITLGPQEEIPALFTVKVDAQFFKTGPDIIVIWPITTHPQKDTLRIPILIREPLGFEGLLTKNTFLSVSGNQLLIHTDLNTNNTLKQVRIFDLSGQLILQQGNEEKNTSIGIDELPRGMFICELLYSNNKRNVMKFVKF
jgi:hypothetical protein